MGAADHDAARRLLDHARMQEWRAVLMGGRPPIHLWRHDRVRDIEVGVARLLVEAHDVVTELAARAVEELSPPANAVSTDATWSGVRPMSP